MFGKKKEDQEPLKAEVTARESAGEPQLSRPLVRPETLAAAARPTFAEAARRLPEFAAAPARRPEPRPEPRAVAAVAPAAHDNEGKKLIVGRGIVLNGEIRTCDKLVVEGRVEAKVTDCHTIEIAAVGLFKGSAQINMADISGCFEGDLTVHNRLTVRSTGRVTGTVRYGQLEVECGGILSGTAELLPDEAAEEPERTSAKGVAKRERPGTFPTLGLSSNGSGQTDK